MSWLVWLGVAVVIAVIAAVTGIKPKETRQVSRTRMMGIGRVFLFLIAIILIYIAYQARSGG